MRVQETLFPIMASATERAAVAELMVPGETPFGRPPLKTSPSGIDVLILSPGEPEDDPDEE